MESLPLRFFMKGSKEKEHRISNLKEMIGNMNDDTDIDNGNIEEDVELINYLNEDYVESDDYEIDDEYIYRPGDDKGNAINLEENNINEDFLIRTPKEKEIENEDVDNDEFIDDFSTGMSEGFDTIINAKIGRTPVLAIISAYSHHAATES